MSVKITYDNDNKLNKFDIELYVPNKNAKKEILEIILLNKITINPGIKYKINIDEVNLYTYNPYIVNKILNKLID